MSRKVKVPASRSPVFEVLAKFHWHLSVAREFPGVHRFIDELRRETKLRADGWRELNVRRLRSLLVSARDSSPYYRNLFEKYAFVPERADLPGDLSRLPVLTKPLVRENLDALLADKAKRSQLCENATGGSTGVPLTFYQDAQYQVVARAIDTQVREWWGIKPHDRTASVWGADRDFRELSLKERFYTWRHRIRSANAFRMSETNLVGFCRMLLRWRPPYLTGYSSALEALAQCARAAGIQNLRFRAIRSAAEVLWPYQRQLIERTFNSPVYDFYGSREVNNLAAECPEARRLHLISTWRYVEIVDEEGRPVPNGMLGYIVVTDLSNYAMPFIRYRNEDLGKLAMEPCPCGRPSPVLAQLIGRSSDLIRTPQGEIVHGEYFTHLFYGRNEIRQFQVHQTSLDRLVVRYVPEGTGASTSIEELADRIRRRLGPEVNIELEVCDHIPVPPSGKHRFTISDVDPRRLGGVQNPPR